jgi:hypothetical protein
LAEIKVNIDSKSGNAQSGTESASVDPKRKRAKQEELQLNRDITAELQKHNKLLEKILTQQEQQRDIAADLRDAVNDTNFDDVENSVSSASKTSKELSKSLRGIGDETDNSMSKLFSETGKADSALTSMAAAGGGAGLALLAIKGLANAVSGLASVASSAISFVSGLVSSLFEVGKAILAIPFRVFEGFVKLSNDVASILAEIQTQIEHIRKQFGDLKGPVAGTVLSLSSSMKGFKATGLSAWGVIGSLAQRIEYVNELATTMGPIFGKLRAEFEADGGAIIAFQKGLGLSAEELKSVGELSISTGKSSRNVLTGMTTQALALGKAFGVDAKVISRDVGKALGDVAHFGGATVKQISVASVYSRKLGLELERIVGTLSAFETFDSAAENSAKLAQSFGVLVDSFSLMEAQSPDEQIDALRKAFFAAGRTTEGMTRQELKLLAQTTGLDEATARLAFSQQNQGMSLDMLKKKSEQAEKKQLTQAEALSKLADSIERLVRQGPEFTGFFDAMLKGFSRGVMTSGPFTKAVFNLRNALMAVWREGGKLGQSFVELFPGVKDLLTGLADLFRPDKFKKFAFSFRKALEQFFKDVTTGKMSFSDLMSKIRTSFFDFLDAEAPSGRKLISGLKTFLLTIAKVVGEGITWAIGALEKGIRFLADFLYNPTEALQNLAGGAKQGASFASQLFAPIISAFTDKKVTGGLIDALDDLLTVVKIKIGKRMEELFLDVKESVTRSFEMARRSSVLYIRQSRNKTYKSKLTGEVTSGHEQDIEEELMAARAKKEKEITDRYELMEYQFSEKRKKDAEAKAKDLVAAQKQAAEKAAKDMQQASSPLAEAQAAKLADAKAKERETADIASRLVTSMRGTGDPVQRARQLSSTVDELATLRDRAKKIDVAAFKELGQKLIELETSLKPVSDALPAKLAAVVWTLNKVSEVKLTALQNMQKAIKAGVIETTAAGVSDMVKVVNELDTALSNIAANKVNIATKLQHLATSLPALGSSGQYSVKSKEVALTVNLTVTMRADEVERVIIQRKESVIRDRLNNAQYRGTSQATEIPPTPTAPSPLPLSPRR